MRCINSPVPGACRGLDIDGHVVYCSVDPLQRKKQLQARHILCAGGLPELPGDAYRDDNTVSVATATLFSLLDERQRRLFAGLESLRFGHGGDRTVADALGLSSATVASGRKQLIAGGFDPHRIRQAGGGRKAIEKKTLPSST